MPELKSCPFCGGEAKLYSSRAADDVAFAYVRCEGCLTSTVDFEDERSDHPTEEAISAWNRRASPPANVEPVAYLIEGNVSRTRYLQFEPEVAECDQPLVTVSKLYLASPPAAVPDGWVLVPRDPTKGMLEAGLNWDLHIEYETYPLSRGVWRAMISAAPAAPNGWQPIDTAPKDRPIAIEYKSGSGWKVTGAQWNKYKRLWETPLVTLLPHEIARWHELPNGLDNPDAKSPAENSDA